MFTHQDVPVNPHPQPFEGRDEAACSLSIGVRANFVLICRVHHPEPPSYPGLGIHWIRSKGKIGKAQDSRGQANSNQVGTALLCPLQ